MMHDALNHQATPDTDDESQTQTEDSTADIAQETGSSPLAGIGGPPEDDGGKLADESTPPDTAARERDWNVSGPVHEYGRGQADSEGDASGNHGDGDSQGVPEG